MNKNYCTCFWSPKYWQSFSHEHRMPQNIGSNSPVKLFECQISYTTIMPSLRLLYGLSSERLASECNLWKNAFNSVASKHIVTLTSNWTTHWYAYHLSICFKLERLPSIALSFFRTLSHSLGAIKYKKTPITKPDKIFSIRWNYDSGVLICTLCAILSHQRTYTRDDGHPPKYWMAHFICVLDYEIESYVHFP